MRPAEASSGRPGKYWQRYGIHESGHIVHGLFTSGKRALDRPI